MGETIKLLPGNQIEITTVKVIPRYSIEVRDSYEDYDYDLDNISMQGIIMHIWDRRFTGLNMNNENITNDNYKECISKDKYDIYYLNAYIHSGTRFYIEDRTRSGWDNSVLGIIAIPKNCDIPLYKEVDHFAEYLTDIWEGTVREISLYDNYHNETIDSVIMYLHLSTEYNKLSRETIEQWAEKYNLEIPEDELY